jgi:hypothetical protein
MKTIEEVIVELRRVACGFEDIGDVHGQPHLPSYHCGKSAGLRMAIMVLEQWLDERVTEEMRSKWQRVEGLVDTLTRMGNELDELAARSPAFSEERTKALYYCDAYREARSLLRNAMEGE